jgi:hypothetical protein
MKRISPPDPRQGSMNFWAEDPAEVSTLAVEQRQAVPVGPVSAPAVPAREWHEVPAARFLGWSREAQLRYCAARDRASAREAETPEWQEFFEQRAKAYEVECAR